MSVVQDFGSSNDTDRGNQESTLGKVMECSVICHNLSHVRTLPIVAAEGTHRGALRHRSLGRGLESPVQYRPDPARPGDSAAPKRTRPTPIPDAMGAHSPLGKRPIHRDGHDQREIGNSRHEACLSGSSEIPQVLDSRRWILRVEKNRRRQAGILLRS